MFHPHEVIVSNVPTKHLVLACAHHFGDKEGTKNGSNLCGKPRPDSASMKMRGTSRTNKTVPETLKHTSPVTSTVTSSFLEFDRWQLRLL
eukprot:1010449-Amphidinium_carterae.1